MAGVRLWDVASGKEVGVTEFDVSRFKSGSAWFAFAPDSRSLIAAGWLHSGGAYYDNEVELRLWEFNAGRETDLGMALGDPSLIRRPWSWHGVDFSPTGDWLAISDSQPRPQVKLWNARTRQLVRTLDLTVEQDAAVPAERLMFSNRGLAFSPDGRWLAALRRLAQYSYETFVWEIVMPSWI